MTYSQFVATEEVESEVVIEVNHEEWICMLCQEAVAHYSHLPDAQALHSPASTDIKPEFPIQNDRETKEPPPPLTNNSVATRIQTKPLRGRTAQQMKSVRRPASACSGPHINIRHSKPTT
jgi:hypothetical protein